MKAAKPRKQLKIVMNVIELEMMMKCKNKKAMKGKRRKQTTFRQMI
jgi:hypothetical protein